MVMSSLDIYNRIYLRLTYLDYLFIELPWKVDSLKYITDEIQFHILVLHVITKTVFETNEMFTFLNYS